MFPLKDNIPTLRFPVVTVAFIVINVLSYFFWQKAGLSLSDPSSTEYVCHLYDYAEIPYEVTHPGEQIAAQGCPPPIAPTWLTVFTAMFMHGSLLHLGGNMLFLWIFGNNVEDSMGPLKFVAFYLLGGIAAGAGQLIIDPNSTVPNLGASGAIAGVLGGYLILFPRRAGDHGDLHHLLLHHPGAARAGDPRVLVPPAGAVRLLRPQRPGRRRRHRVLGPHRRLPLGAPGHTAVRRRPQAPAAAAGRGRAGLSAVRTAVLATALAFIAILAFLTLFVLFSSGPDVLVITSLGVLGVIALGVIGAMGTK